MSRQEFKYLENKKNFQGKLKKIITFTRLLIAKILKL